MRANHLMPMLMAAVIVLLAASAFQRNGVWTTKLSLWTDVARKTPNKSRVLNSLGNCHMLLGDYFRAIAAYKRAIALDKANIEAYYNLASNLERVGLAREALGYYAFFCRTAPREYPERTQTSCERVARLKKELAATDR